MSCECVLVVASVGEMFDDLGEALQEDGVPVVRVDRIEGGLVALRSGYLPGAILIDLDDEVASYGDFLRLLFEEPDWRNIPVIAANRSSRVWFQIAPRHLYRKLPAPDDVSQLCTLLKVVASHDDRGDAWRT